MANTTISPNMNMPVPVPGTDPGPDWANNIVADMSIIDSHNHSSGQGVQINPSGININADLPFNTNNATLIRSVRLYPQGSPLALAADIGCLYESGADLYYNDGAGNQVRITQSGSVTGSSGTITGLPSGTASASFSGGTFTFQSATNTPATMNVGPIITGATSVSPKTVTLSASGSQPADYAMTWPLALPSNGSSMLSDSSGNLSFLTLASGAYSPTISAIFTSGSCTITITSSAFYYQRIGTVVSISGSATYDVTAIIGGTVRLRPTITLPFATAALTATGVMSYRDPIRSNVDQATSSGTTLIAGVGGVAYSADTAGNYISFNVMYRVL